MRPLKFETQPHYQLDLEDGVWDSRVLETLGSISADAATDTAAQDTRTDYMEKRWNIPYVHKPRIVESAGSDGEDASGAVTLADTKTTDGRTLSSILSQQSEHRTGMPLAGRSWITEFDDPKLARDFWKSWKPSFVDEDVIESLIQYVKDKPEIPKGSIRLQTLGLLVPRQYQKVSDHSLLDNFATYGDELVHVPKQLQADPDFTPGQVYVVPEHSWFSLKVESHVAKTCLAAFVQPPYRSDCRARPTEYTIVQWADGNLEFFDPRDTKVNPAVKPTPMNIQNLKGYKTVLRRTMGVQDPNATVSD